jgi:hypothetical protein
MKQRIDQEQAGDGPGEGHSQEIVCRVLKETGGHRKSGSGSQHEAAEDRREASVFFEHY